MEESVRDPSRPAGRGPGLLEIADRSTAAVEHQRSNANIAVLLEKPRLPTAVNQLGQLTFEHDGAAPASLGRFRPQSKRPSVSVYVSPFEGDDLALPPAKILMSSPLCLRMVWNMLTWP